MRRSFRLTARILVVAWLAGSSAGCRDRGVEHDDEPAGHEIPAHKPRDFPAAVKSLGVINGGLATEASPDNVVETLEIALDIANWLPEIAAESDMPEEPWNEVKAHAESIADVYRSALAQPSTDARNAATKASAAIGAIEKVLADSEPRWFGEPRKTASR